MFFFFASARTLVLEKIVSLSLWRREEERVGRWVVGRRGGAVDEGVLCTYCETGKHVNPIAEETASTFLEWVQPVKKDDDDTLLTLSQVIDS